MKHIVHVSNDFAPMYAGINTHLQNLLPEISKRGFKVTLLVPTASDQNSSKIYIENLYEGFTCVRANFPVRTNPVSKLFHITKTTNAGLQWIEEEIGKIDLIHQHDQRATRLGSSFFARRNSIPIIWTNHSSGFFKKSDLSVRMLTYIPFIRPDGVVVVHRMLLERFQHFFNRCPVRYIPNGVNTSHFSPSKINSKRQTIVFFPQRMIPQKGAMELAKAAKLLLDNPELSKIQFWFAGSGKGSNRNQNYIHQVKNLLAQDVKNGKVKFLGNPSYIDMPELYRKSDIVVLPLQLETENISVFEAWASGTPLITTKNVEKNGYMKHEENCIIVPDNDPESLADEIARLAADVELRRKLADNGRRLVEKQFTWSHAAEKTVLFYREILNSDNA